MSKNSGIRPVRAPVFLPEPLDEQTVHTDTIEDDIASVVPIKSVNKVKSTPRAALNEAQRIQRQEALLQAQERDK